jgi:predicted AAA+ superfamily ATPase
MRTINEKQIQNKLKTLNSHWTTNHIDSAITAKRKRRYFDLFFPLVSQFDVQRAILLMGTRRVGKTVMLKQTIQQFIDNGKKAKELIYIPLDEPLFYNTSLEELVLLFKKTVNINSLAETIIIFDEVQYTKDWNIHLKVLVDNYPQTKFVASGSAAGAIKKQGLESGAGRFTDFILPALTFYEYLEMLQLTDNYIIFNENDNKAADIKNIDQLNTEFINYLNYGGFPEAIFNNNIRNDFDRYIRGDIVDKVLLRDLPSLYGITDIQELNRLFSYLCYQTGNEINYDALSKASGVAKNTLKKYIQYLETAFLIRTVRRVNETGKTFKRNNYFKIYLTNPSMYSALYGIVDDSETLGQLVETALFSQWAHDATWLDRIYYARFKK